MKSTEQITNDGTYGTVQSQHELNRLKHGDGRKTADYNASILVKPATGHRTINAKSLDCEQSKWIPSLGGHNTISSTNCGEIATLKKSKDWLLSARNYHAKSEPTKEHTTGLGSEMSIATTKLLNQTNLNTIENAIANPHRNHSSDLKASATAFISTNTVVSSSCDRPRIDQKQLLAGNPTQPDTFIANAVHQPADINRTNKQISSFNGNDVHSTENYTESSHKSITNHGNHGISSSSKLNENSKTTKKPAPSERKYKQKSDTKATHKKRKHLNSGGVGVGGKNGSALSGGGRKCTSNQIHHESLQRLPLRANENDTCANGKRLDLDKEWHSPESYIYDDISSDTMTDGGDSTSCMQTFWFRDIPNENLLTREQRLENKRDNLRRQAFQYAQAQHFRSTILAKRRLITVTKALAKFKNERNK